MFKSTYSNNDHVVLPQTGARVVGEMRRTSCALLLISTFPLRIVCLRFPLHPFEIIVIQASLLKFSFMSLFSNIM